MDVDIFSLKLQRSLHKGSCDYTAICGEAECIAGDMISAKNFRCTLTCEFTELSSWSTTLLSFTMVKVGKDPKYEVYLPSFGTEHWYANRKLLSIRFN